MDATHQGGAFIQEVSGAFRFVRNQCAHLCACVRGGEIGFGDAEALHVLGGQVDAVAAEVLGHVLEVLDDLQCGADRVRAADPLGCGGAGDAEHEPADRVRRQFAVGEEVLVGGVAADDLVLAVGLDEAEEGRGREAVAPDGGLQGAEQRVADVVGADVEDPAQVRLEGIEHGEAVLGRLRGQPQPYRVRAAAVGQVPVADVVDEPGEAVDGHQVGTPGTGDEEGCDGEVLAGRLVEDGT